MTGDSSLAKQARQIMIAYLHKKDIPHDSRSLACFVTLTKRGRLRGCIGFTTPVKGALTKATLAACDDPRMTVVTADEIPEIDVEVSVLTAPKQVPLEYAVREFKAGIYGIIISQGRNSGLLLPQVFSAEKTIEEALEMTCRKAGLPDDAWKEWKTSIEFFTVSISQSDASDS